MQDEVTQAADLLTKAIGDISAALTMAGKADKITEWTAPYVAEYAYRHNPIGLSGEPALASLIREGSGKRLKYAELIA